MVPAPAPPAAADFRTEPRWLVWLIAAALGVATLLAYANTFHAPFVLDDFQSVVENPSIQHPSRFREVFLPDSGTTAGRPLLNLSFALNYAWSGTDVWTYHVVNVAIHVLAGLMLFALVRGTLRLPRLRTQSGAHATALASVASAVWLLHPLLTESVTYVSERSEQLAGLCLLVVLYGRMRSVEARSPLPWLVLSAAAAWCGIAIKEVLVTAPVVVLLYDRAYVSRSFREAAKRHPLYYIALVSVWLLLAWLMTRFPIAGRGVGFELGLTPYAYAAIEARALAKYLCLSAWPHPLVFDYGPGRFASGGTESIVFPIVALLLVITAVYAWIRSKPLGFLPLVFLLLLAPTSSIVPIALQPMAESRLYLPLAAIVVLGTLATYTVIERFRGRKNFTAFIVVAIVALGCTTAARNQDYHSAIALWSDTVRKVPANPRAHQSLGTALAAAGQKNQAMAEFEAALRIAPDYAPAHYNLGVLLLNDGHAAEAVPHLERALTVPHDGAAAHLYLGQAYAEIGRYRDAVPILRDAVRLSPGNAEAEFALGNTLAADGKYHEAAQALAEAVRLAPSRAQIHNNLANALIYDGQIDEAIVEYKRALLLRPSDASIRDNLDQALRYQAAHAVRPSTDG